MFILLIYQITPEFTRNGVSTYLTVQLKIIKAHRVIKANVWQGSVLLPIKDRGYGDNLPADQVIQQRKKEKKDRAIK